MELATNDSECDDETLPSGIGSDSGEIEYGDLRSNFGPGEINDVDIPSSCGSDIELPMAASDAEDDVPQLECDFPGGDIFGLEEDSDLDLEEP